MNPMTKRPIIELLALPAWQSPPRTLEDWVAGLSANAGPVVVTRESTGVAWVEIGSHRVRGYVVLEGGHVEAINFELSAPDPAPAVSVLEAAAQAMGWELHPDEPDEEAEDED
jgi:hypothetical protein